MESEVEKASHCHCRQSSSVGWNVWPELEIGNKVLVNAPHTLDKPFRGTMFVRTCKSVYWTCIGATRRTPITSVETPDISVGSVICRAVGFEGFLDFHADCSCRAYMSGGPMLFLCVSLSGKKSIGGVGRSGRGVVYEIVIWWKKTRGRKTGGFSVRRGFQAPIISGQ